MWLIITFSADSDTMDPDPVTHPPLYGSTLYYFKVRNQKQNVIKNIKFKLINIISINHKLD